MSRADLVGHLIELHHCSPMMAVYYAAERHRILHAQWQDALDHDRENLSRAE